MPMSDTFTTARDRNPARKANSIAATPRQSLRRSFKALRVCIHANNIACSSHRLAVPSKDQLTPARGGTRRHIEPPGPQLALGEDTGRGAHIQRLANQYETGQPTRRLIWPPAAASAR